MWALFSFLPSSSAVGQAALSLVARHGWSILSYLVVAGLSAWAAWTVASDDPTRREREPVAIEDILVEQPDVVTVASETTQVLDTTCAAIPEGIVPDQETEESKNGLPIVEYRGGRPPYITVEVTESGPALEVTPQSVVLQGYSPRGKLRSYRYSRDRRRFSAGPFVSLNGGPRAGGSAGLELRWEFSPRVQLTGRAGKRLRPGWTGSLSLTYALL